MPNPAAIMGCQTQGHNVGPAFFPPTISTQGSSDVFIEGKAAVRSDDTFMLHCFGPSCHIPKAIGTSKVFVNGKPLAMMTDKTDCGDTIMTNCSTTVIVG